MVGVSQETFLNDHLLKKDYPSRSSTIQKNLASFLSGIETWYYRNSNERVEWKENRWIRRLNHRTSKVEVECVIILVELILTVVWWIIREFLTRNGILEIFLTLEFQSWKVNFGTQALSTNSRSSDHYALDQGSWDCQINLTNLWHRDRLIIGQHNFPHFDVLDAMIASALKKLLNTQSIFRKRVSGEEQRAQKDDRFLQGRQIAYMMYEYFSATRA